MLENESIKVDARRRRQQLVEYRPSVIIMSDSEFSEWEEEVMMGVEDQMLVAEQAMEYGRLIFYINLFVNFTKLQRERSIDRMSVV